jgi:hypothetical protein
VQQQGGCQYIVEQHAVGRILLQAEAGLLAVGAYERLMPVLCWIEKVHSLAKHLGRHYSVQLSLALLPGASCFDVL